MTAEGAGAAINFEPVTCFVAGEFPLLDAGITPTENIARSRVYFRAAQGASFYYIEMTQESGTFFGKLPRPRVEASPITYYLQATTTEFEESQTPEIEAVVVEKKEDCGDRVVAVFGPPGEVVVFSAATGAAISPVGFAAGGAALAIGTIALIIGGAAAAGVVGGIIVNPSPTPPPDAHARADGDPDPHPDAHRDADADHDRRPVGSLLDPVDGGQRAASAPPAKAQSRKMLDAAGTRIEVVKCRSHTISSSSSSKREGVTHAPLLSRSSIEGRRCPEATKSIRGEHASPSTQRNVPRSSRPQSSGRGRRPGDWVRMAPHGVLRVGRRVRGPTPARLADYQPAGRPLPPDFEIRGKEVT